MNVRNFIVPSAVLAATLLSGSAFAAGGEPQDGTTLKAVRAVAQAPQKVFRGHQADQLLALETGVRPRDVRMIETTVARNARYQFGWQQKTGKRFAEALGSDRYNAWSRGHSIQLYSPAVIEEANRMAGRAPNSSTLERVAVNP
ncbi:hypothetical protein [Thermomonas fusca]|uniref:Uncharacterized protein n=1 Tax=Thermomonas fusca TaxID=215690 RepID=A0A5R9PJF3_9GAMM|nr:hypothetical protein [Thermomonas fusca]TLX22868.1 hypothetical protein E5S66_02250 [Thermomonas fusca]